MDKLKRKKFTINKDDETQGVYCISLVNEPAIEVDFQHFGKEKLMFKTISDEKRIIIGPLMIPDFEMLRFDKVNNEYYYGIFDVDTIKFASQKYMLDNRNDSYNIEHSKKVSDIGFVESWIIEDPKIDKSNLYGYDLPNGTWFGVVKIDNEDVWENYIKTGVLNGFSVEVLAEPVEIKQDEENEYDEFINGIMNLLSDYE